MSPLYGRSRRKSIGYQYEFSEGQPGNLPTNSQPLNRVSTYSYCEAQQVWIPVDIDPNLEGSGSTECMVSKSDILEDEWAFPDYGGEAYSSEEEDLSDNSSAREDDLLMPKTAGDDSILEIRPQRQVDYYTYAWDLQHMIATWRYLRRRRDIYFRGWRMENTVWRHWAKRKYCLGTISPTDIEWDKANDNPWLYGPIIEDESDMPVAARKICAPVSPNSGPTYKSILKKPTPSEALQRHSHSADSLIHRANVLVFMENIDLIAPLYHNSSAIPASPLYCRRSLKAAEATLSIPSGISSPVRRKHITFNNVVSQAAVVDNEEDRSERKIESHLEGNYSLAKELCLLDDDLESDESPVTMKPLHSPPPLTRESSKSSSSSGGTRSIIALLPPTTINFGSDMDAMDDPHCQYPPKPRPGLLRTFSMDSIETYTKDSSADGLTDCEHIEFDASDIDFLDSFPDENEKIDEFHVENSCQERWFLSPTGSTTDDIIEREIDPCIHWPLPDNFVDVTDTIRDLAHVFWNVGW